MYLYPSSDNKSNSEVAEVQRMLNSIRVNFHHDWEYLMEDGIYGKRTAHVVRQFQIYRGISSQMTVDGPILGNTTVQYIREAYQNVPRIASAAYSTPYKVSQKVNPLQVLEEITDQIMGCIGTFDDFLKREIFYTKSLRASNSNALKQRFYSFATRMDPMMIRLKKHLVALNDKNTRPWDSHRHTKRAQKNRIDLVKELKEFDIVSKIEMKIEMFLKSKGLSDKIKIGNSKSKETIKIKCGGILTAWNYRHLIIDLCSITEWGTEKWNADIQKHFYEVLDGYIIGYASTVIAELIVGATVAAVGATISVGWIVAIIAIAALLISLLFSFFMSDADVSFSQKAIEGYSGIISLVKF